MPRTVRAVFAIAALIAALPGVASSEERAPGGSYASPAGTWEIEMRDSRYLVEMCGDDGASLCGTLTWLGNGADTPENMPYLNTMLIDHATPSATNEWQGQLNIFGQSAAGTITQVSDDTIILEGCFLVVFCRNYSLYRMAES